MFEYLDNDHRKAALQTLRKTHQTPMQLAGLATPYARVLAREAAVTLNPFH